MADPMIPTHMAAVLLTGYGGLDKLEYREDVPVPRPEPGEVLIQVCAAGVNNTDINTRSGWYNRAVTTGTEVEGAQSGFAVQHAGSGDWGSDMSFPRIQGADVAGHIVAVGTGVDPRRIGERVVCDPYFHAPGDTGSMESTGFLGAHRDGGFAQFTAVPGANAITVAHELPLSDAQLATVPCSGGTAMNMLLMAGLRAGDHVLVTGASGGVGSFLVQIARACGATVVAVCGADKSDAVRKLGAHAVIDRAVPDLPGAVRMALGHAPLTLFADVVGGDAFTSCIGLLGTGGRYVTAGAIAGPMVSLDLRTLYLKSLSFFGSSVYRRDALPALLALLQRGAVVPAVSDVSPLAQIHAAQTAFLAKHHVGSKVLQPPPLASA
jgi:NADPH:quinone reductase-like Zn-dependent oxidoreductase